MKRIIYISLVLIFCQMHLYAQKETSWWYFGFNAGLNFNSLSNVTASDGTVVSNMPEAIVGPLSTREGCFTVSTYDGQLLFSSDGSTVYDKNGNIMTNGTGLLGNFSATQSGIAIPKPGSTTEYYIITVPAMASTDGLRYSVVDISKNGGLGEITSKNKIIKSGSVFENIAAVPNSNGKDYWLIHRTLQTFYVWAITSSGVASTPTSTITNTLINTHSPIGGIRPQGEIILSSDYKRIASVNWEGQQIITAIFDPITGVMSDSKVLKTSANLYGGTFSPNNEYLYLGTGFYNYGQLYVGLWNDIRTGNPITLLSDKFSNVKAGLDNRLYGIQVYSSGANEIPSKNIGVVLNPDTGGTDIKYFPNYLKNTAALGLPSFAVGFIRIIPKEQPFACAAHSRTYSIEVDLSGGNAPDKLEWYFGDGTPKVVETVSSSQSKYSQEHLYNNAGNYTITITPYKADGTKLDNISMTANIVYCTLKTNLMTRSELLNSKQQKK